MRDRTDGPFDAGRRPSTTYGASRPGPSTDPPPPQRSPGTQLAPDDGAHRPFSLSVERAAGRPEPRLLPVLHDPRAPQNLQDGPEPRNKAQKLRVRAVQQTCFPSAEQICLRPILKDFCSLPMNRSAPARKNHIEWTYLWWSVKLYSGRMCSPPLPRATRSQPATLPEGRGSPHVCTVLGLTSRPKGDAAPAQAKCPRRWHGATSELGCPGMEGPTSLEPE
ncbi:hypothetical protein LXA43DRAFT_630432 [Ganoderma leucocontextum]|nr:hypothetical protein LXA43DRAFT_630432 [Ganoderma leucocontextum]